MDRNYKVLNGLSACNGGKYTFTLGVWADWIEQPIKIGRGYHFARGDVQLLYPMGTDIYEIEVDGVVTPVGEDMFIAQSIRLISHVYSWSDRTARLFACDCADRVTGLSRDERAHDAVRMARAYANGEATWRDLAAARADVSACARSAYDTYMMVSSSIMANGGSFRDFRKQAAEMHAASAAEQTTAIEPHVASSGASLQSRLAASCTTDEPDSGEKMRSESVWQAARMRQYMDGEVL